MILTINLSLYLSYDLLLVFFRKNSPQKFKSKQNEKERNHNTTKMSTFNVAEYEASTRIPKEEIIEIKQAFDIFDSDGSGSIDPKELREAFLELGWKGNSKFIFKIL